MNRYGQSSNTAEQALSNVQGKLALADTVQDEQQRSQIWQMAFNHAHDFIKKKPMWSVFLEKLMYEFIDLAFNTNKHFSIKQALRSYRSVTQGQYSESLKDVLEHYRDRKIAQMLEDITEQDEKILRQMPDIQDQQASSSIILSSFNPQVKQSKENLKNKVRIIWEGYKSIVDTVKVNQKLEEVYMATLIKVFQFVEKFNRKKQFENFCKSLRDGLKIALNRRERSDQQKSIYIDLDKVQVNNRNIQMRMKLFEVTKKLGLWRQSFQVLEDINNLMRIRRGRAKTSTLCQYYQNLAILFRNSNYWHYHAFAYYSYYQAYLNKPNIKPQEKRQVSDQLLLSMMCIPPATLESKQSKQSQQKICAMLSSSIKIPSKQQLYEMMVSKGIAENASEHVGQLWNFMFLEFDLTSLAKGLQLLKKINDKNNQFKPLIEDILIYKQLISVAEVYQRIKVSSLLALIPLEPEKINKILLASHEQQIINFSLDESEGIIIFEDNDDEITNPNDEFYDVFVDVAIAKQKHRKMDKEHILKKTIDFLNDPADYFWKRRMFKIGEYKKKLKRPQQQMEEEQMRRKRDEKYNKQKQQILRKQRQIDLMKKAKQKREEFISKKVQIEEIIKIKGVKVVKIEGKKVQALTDDDLQSITLDTLKDFLEQTKKKVANDTQNRMKKTFTKIEYFERERRLLIKENLLNDQQEDRRIQQINRVSLQDFQEKKSTYEKLAQSSGFLKTKINDQFSKLQQSYKKDYENYKKKLEEEFKQKILGRAKKLKEQYETKLKEQKQREQSERIQDSTGMWAFRSSKVQTQGSNISQVNQGFARKDQPRVDTGEISIGGNFKKSQNTVSVPQVKEQATWFGKNNAGKKQMKIEVKQEIKKQPSKFAFQAAEPEPGKNDTKGLWNENKKDIQNPKVPKGKNF